MEQTLFFFFFVVMAAAVVMLIVYGIQEEKKRRAAFLQFAEAHGLHFDPSRRSRQPPELSFLPFFGRGENRYSHYWITGRWGDFECSAFEYHYEVTTRNEKSSSTTHYYHAVFTLTLPDSCPVLLISPENFLTRIAGAIGFSDIQLESAEFNRAFQIRSKDKRFAYDICHPRAMEFLLAHPGTHLALGQNQLCFYQSKRLQVAALESTFRWLVDFYQLIPAYLWNQPSRVNSPPLP
jgi:hypothetical protein